jgi:NAD(P)-dependent dehydrogenase (short-subunit alcohol dehydrogenase family)
MDSRQQPDDWLSKRRNDTMRLDSRIAVITGAGSGIGRAMATRFAAEGARIVAADWNAQRLDEVVAAIQASGGTVVGAQGNIAEKATAEALVELAISTYGRLDILCNNAGVMDYMQGVGEMADDIWRRVLSINLDGPMFATRKAIPHMIAQGNGAIVNTASTAGISGAAAGAAYTVSKHALVGLTRNTAWMYAKKGIRCNAICPGGTATNIAETMIRERMDAEGSARAGAFAALIPEFLQPDDIALLALFLASDESRHINGAIIPADAGWTAA